MALGVSGTTLLDEVNRLANGGTYRASSEMVGEALAARQWSVQRAVTTNVLDTVGVLNQIKNNLPFVHAATTAATAGIYLAGTTGADGGTGVGATLTAPSNARLIVDGHTINNGERVLYWQNTNATTNGIYYVTNEGSASTKWVLTRANFADNEIAGEIVFNKNVYVENGTTYAGKTFRVTSEGTGPSGSVVIGTQNMNFELVTETSLKNTSLDYSGVCNYLALTTGLPAAQALRGIST